MRSARPQKLGIPVVLCWGTSSGHCGRLLCWRSRIGLHFRSRRSPSTLAYLDNRANSVQALPR